jgi:hypothetical protein
MGCKQWTSGQALVRKGSVRSPWRAGSVVVAAVATIRAVVSSAAPPTAPLAAGVAAARRIRAVFRLRALAAVVVRGGRGHLWSGLGARTGIRTLFVLSGSVRRGLGSGRLRQAGVALGRGVGQGRDRAGRSDRAPGDHVGRQAQGDGHDDPQEAQRDHLGAAHVLMVRSGVHTEPRGTFAFGMPMVKER